MKNGSLTASDWTRFSGAVFGYKVPDTLIFKIIAVGGGVLAGVLFVSGVLLVYAGYNVTQYCGRILSFAALGLSLVTIFTCYCAPTSFALAVYGLIFLLNQPFSLAFTLRSQGYSSRKIQQAFFTLH